MEYGIENGVVKLRRNPDNGHRHTVIHTGDYDDRVADIRINEVAEAELVGIYRGEPPLCAGEYETVLGRVEVALGLKERLLVDRALERFDTGEFLDGRQTV